MAAAPGRSDVGSFEQAFGPVGARDGTVALVAASRLYRGIHVPTGVIGGPAVGFACHGRVAVTSMSR